MSRAKPPKRPGNCPAGGDHAVIKVSERDGIITHRCRKCGETWTRRQEPMEAAS